MQPPGLVYKKAVLKSFVKFTGTHLYQSPFFDKIAVWIPATLRKRECGTSAFICISILQNTSGLLLLASEEVITLR